MTLAWLKALLPCCRDPESFDAAVQQDVGRRRATAIHTANSREIGKRRSGLLPADRDKVLPRIPEDNFEVNSQHIIYRPPHPVRRKETLPSIPHDIQRSTDDQHGQVPSSLDANTGRSIGQNRKDTQMDPTNHGLPTPPISDSDRTKVIRPDSGVLMLSPIAGDDDGGYPPSSPAELPNITDKVIPSRPITRPSGNPYAPPPLSATRRLQAGDHGTNTRLLSNRRHSPIAVDRLTISGGEVAENPDTRIRRDVQGGIARVGDQLTTPFSTPLPPLAEGKAHPSQPEHGPAGSRGRDTISPPTTTIIESTFSREKLAVAPDRNAARRRSSTTPAPPARSAPVKQAPYDNRGSDVIPYSSICTIEDSTVAGKHVAATPEERTRANAGKLPPLHPPPGSPNELPVVPRSSFVLASRSHYPQPAKSDERRTPFGQNQDGRRGRNHAPPSPIDESTTGRKQTFAALALDTGSSVGMIPRPPLPPSDPVRSGSAHTQSGPHPPGFSLSIPAMNGASFTSNDAQRHGNDTEALVPVPSFAVDREQGADIRNISSGRLIHDSPSLPVDLSPSGSASWSKVRKAMSTTRPAPHEPRKRDTGGSRIDESTAAGGQVPDALHAGRSAGKLPLLHPIPGAPDGLVNAPADLSSTHGWSPPSIPGPTIGNDPPGTELGHHLDGLEENAHPMVFPSVTSLSTIGERQVADAPDSGTVYSAGELSSFPTQVPKKILGTTHSRSIDMHPAWTPHPTPASGHTCPTHDQDTSHASASSPLDVPEGITSLMENSSGNLSATPAPDIFRGDQWNAHPMFINNAGGEIKLTSGPPGDPDGLASTTGSQSGPHTRMFSSSPPVLNAANPTQTIQDSNGTRWREADDNQALNAFSSSTVDAERVVHIPDTSTGRTIGNSPSLSVHLQRSRSTTHSKAQTPITMSTTRRAPHEQLKDDTRGSRIASSPSSIDELTVVGGQAARDVLHTRRSVGKLPRPSPIAGAPEEVIKVRSDSTSTHRFASPSIIPSIGNDARVPKPGQRSDTTEEGVVNEHPVVSTSAASIPTISRGQAVVVPDGSNAKVAGETSSFWMQVAKTILDTVRSQSGTPHPIPSSGDTLPAHSRHRVVAADPGHSLDDTRPPVAHLTKDLSEQTGMAVNRATNHSGANSSLEVPEVRPTSRTVDSSSTRSNPIKQAPGSISPGAITFKGSHWRANSMTINNAGGDIKLMSGRPGWDVLAKHASPQAFHTSKVVARLGKCDHNTRVKVLDRICEWAVRQGAPRSLFMTGAAGSGKTAIALTTADLLEKRAALAASFFSSMDSTRSDLSGLIPSIAYQLGSRIPSLADSIGDLVAHNQHIFAASLEEQVMQLIVKPWKLLGSATVPDPPFTVLIDAADECRDEWEQDSLVALVTNEILWVGTPFRFFITARPEVIHAATGRFDESHCIRLSDDTRYDANEDIKTSLRIHLPRLVKKDVSVLEKDIDAIVAASSGQYIYPATAIGYIEEGKRDSPMQRLKAIVGWILNSPRAETQNPLQRLDKLFENILLLAMGKYALNPSNGGDTSKNPLVLLLQAYARLNIKTILQPTSEHEDIHDRILGLDNGSFNSVVYDVRCLVRVRELTEHGPIVEFYHRICLEFLQSRAKGEGLHFDKDRIDLYLLKRLCAVFIDSSDEAFALIESNDGVFTDNDKAWTNCTSVFLLGGVLKSMLSESSSKKGQITRSLKAKDRKSLSRFFSPKNRGWEKLEEWALLVSRHHQLQEDGSTKLALLEWGQYLDTLLQYQDNTKIRVVKNVLDAMRMTG